MNAISYGEFSQGLRRQFGDTRLPVDVTLEVTRRCPLVCQHCYNNLPMGDMAARKRELSKEEYFAILNELADMGVIWLLFTGGEIFARKDFLEIYTFAKQKGFLITLFTNGILINDKIADHLREFPPFAIEITMYGRTKETYERLTRLPGSYERCLRGIELLLDRGLPLKLKTVGTQINRHEVIAIRQFAEQELGVDFKFDSLINPRIDCSQAPLAVRLSPEDVVALDLYWPDVAQEHQQRLDRDLAAPPVQESTVYVCGGGFRSFAINAYGQMSLCIISQQETYDLRAGTVRDGWEQFLSRVRTRERTRPTKCDRCRIQTVCSMCPANGELENGDPESPVEFLCEVAHLRALALGFEVPEHGECEFCGDTPQRTALLHSAERLASHERRFELCTAPRTLLPILNNTTGNGACSGCRSL
jgi:radical SAM protein with 4Fe4S-binding SPASM domain